ncbi:GNAT family protein [Gorillibacterium sp. CAU 1737]|uniref:GNAT family N-acetyltransferase n=1 Tax=Gorillibacterium sp. CAU 1737 TaxID=3140362 RepID=UPI0032619D72
MNPYLFESELIRLRQTQAEEVEVVLAWEQHPDHVPFVGQWTREQHLRSLTDEDLLHLVVEDTASGQAVGYLLLAGLLHPHRSLEFRRIVIARKGSGFGRAALQAVKQLAFERYHAHRLWLDVREPNRRAYHLYRSEGFVEEGTLRECIRVHDGTYESLIVMSILRREYES